MPDRRGSRFVLEVLFLLALAVALTLTTLSPIEIAGVMLLGWVIVAIFEWAAWREEPHYGSGLPPRYYVPQVNLPPAQPLEPVSAGYPEARDEAPTWIASPALRAEMLGEWPSAAPTAAEPPVSDPPAQPLAEPPVLPLPVQESAFDPWMAAEELPLAPLGELDPPEPEPAAEEEPEVVAAEPAAPAPEPVAAEPEPLPNMLLPPVSQPSPAASEEPASEPEREPVEEEAAPSLEVELTRSVQGVARYSLDPLAEPQPKRRFSRSSPSEQAAVEVPARPEGVRPLPGRSNRQD